MPLILRENSFKFNGKHYPKTQGIAMSRKMAVAFAVIFMGHIENVAKEIVPDSLKSAQRERKMCKTLIQDQRQQLPV